MNFAKLINESTYLFSSENKNNSSSQTEAIFYILDQLDHKEKKLRRKLEKVFDSEEKNELIDKIRVIVAQKKKGMKRLRGK